MFKNNYIYIYIYMYMCVCMYACMYACIYLLVVSAHRGHLTAVGRFAAGFIAATARPCLRDTDNVNRRQASTELQQTRTYFLDFRRCFLENARSRVLRRPTQPPSPTSNESAPHPPPDPAPPNPQPRESERSCRAA